LRADLSRGSVDVVAAGWSGIGSVAVFPDRRIAILAGGGRWPRGFALGIDLDTGRETMRWAGLNRPGHLLARTNDKVLLSTADGLVELAPP
jgi:hypothetical protein